MHASKPQRVAVVGLGRFGMALARRLAMHRAEVIAIDKDGRRVKEICNDVAIAVQLDSTDESALRGLEVDGVDCVAVCIGENFESALLTTVVCKKKLEVPHVICRAQTQLHADIFRQIGADEVIQPEQNAGDALGRRLAHPAINDFITLGDGFTVIELVTPTEFVGKTIREVDLRSRYETNLIAIRRLPEVAAESAGQDANDTDKASQDPPVPELISVPRPNETLRKTDVLVLAGSDDSLSRLPQI